MLSRLGYPLLAALAIVLALGAASAAAESPPGPAADDAATIATELHPGWNLVGWIGPDTPVADLFAEVPALLQVSARDTQAGRYVRALRGDGSPTGALKLLSPGMGLWLRIDGDEPVTWTRPAEAAGVLLQLRKGLNLAAWSGGPGSLEDALAGFGAAFSAAHRWNAQTQSYETYVRGAAGAAAVLDDIAPGDGLWVSLSTPVRWWQQGEGAPPMVFVGDIDGDTASAIGAEFRDVTTRLAERFENLEGTEITAHIHAEVDTLHAAYEERYGQAPDAGLCHYWSGSGIAYAASCDEPFGAIVGRAYIELLRDTVAPFSELPAAEEGYSRRGPQWLLLGTREYVNALYRAETGSETYRQLRAALVAPARRTTLPLSSMETRAGRDAAGRPETIALGFLATELLAERAGDEAILDYFRLLPSSTSWRAAFEGAFGVTVEGFHGAFEASRFEHAPLLPHLADDLDEPVFVFVGDIAEDVQEELRVSLEATRELLAAHFGVEASDFTVYVGSDLAAVAPDYIAVRGRENPELCGDQDHNVIFEIVSCKDPALVLAHEYVHVLQHQLAAGASPGPAWLTEGVAVYGEALRRAVIERGLTASEGLDGRRRQEAAALLLDGEVPALRSFETVADDAERIHYLLGFLAADRLAARSGVEALASYYRRLPSSDDWQEAFEGAFGIAIEDFYESFEAYRSEVAPAERTAP